MNNKTEHHNLMLLENGYPHLAADRDEEPVLILSESGMPVLQTMQGCTMPADYSFACINNYVHCEDPMYEDLQNLALGMASYIEDQIRQIAEAARDANAKRMQFLHSINKDAEGFEYGVAKARWGTDGKIEFYWTASDHSDIDVAIASSKEPQ